MKKSEIGVHVNHCCVKHGCKYGDSDCPVVLGKVKQIGPCWDCYEEGNYDGPDESVKPPDIEWVSPPEPPPKRIINEDVKINKEFIKGFIWAVVIVLLLHVGLAYILLL